MNLLAESSGCPLPDHNTWRSVIARNPEHSVRYAQRWRDLDREGKDLDGEARLVDALADRSSRILDAGCGTGRTGGYLATRGHTVIGLDLDEYLIDVAREDFPNGRWHVADLEQLPASLSAQARLDLSEPFDLIVSAGNVMGFLSKNGRHPALTSLCQLLAPQAHSRAIIGFGAGRGWDFRDFLTDARACGFDIEQLFSSWQAHPFNEDSDFLVAVLTRSDQSATAKCQNSSAG
ncbi:class I SAM-dependent methyltransferase [Auritidibacter ignavus]|uniref:class I SAM-dependent methyltransferase n=1 Tax=Auritidibacter ignavus TaxID=678932 RepID=UPI0024492016|nr:class I SAM-dependent methyltransferase [Auritidibacter ignavus]WGH83675.1 class I SAM-dependent methyltransferase [Auritidibacter ignavus]